MDRYTMFVSWKPQYCKDVICPKLVCVIPIKIQVDFLFFCRNWQTDSNIYTEMHKAKNGQGSLEKDKTRGLTLQWWRLQHQKHCGIGARTYN